MMIYVIVSKQQIAVDRPNIAVLAASNSEAIESAYPPLEVTKVALRLKHQVEQVIPIELEEEKITKANSPIITRKVLKTAKESGGKDYPSCVIYCLLVCKKWFERQALKELWDSDLHEARAVACEVIAKKLYAFLLLLDDF
jgi:hypothetical protein